MQLQCDKNNWIAAKWWDDAVTQRISGANMRAVM